MIETDSNPTCIKVDEWLRRISAVVAPESEPVLRRSFRRYSVTGEVKAVGCRDDGTPFRRTWTLLQVSAEGLSIKSEEPLPVETQLELAVNIDGNPMPVRGTVVHCTQTLGGYKLGVRLHFPA
ncbi:MAG: PilZ domain-containing protein [Planctomycetes bacterium]|nr:PilZ domain-containing protein [Planctomycetota bacterium]